MNEDFLRRLLDELRPQVAAFDIQQLRSFLAKSWQVPDPATQARLLDRLTQPALRLIWALEPEAGHDCVQTVQVRLPAALRGMPPKLTVAFPDRLKASGKTDIELEYCPGADPFWTANLQFRLPEDLLGTYLWNFTVSFEHCWGHAELRRVFKSQYTAKIRENDKGETELEMSCGDFANLRMPDLTKWKKIRIQLGKHVNMLTPLEAPDLGSVLRGEEALAPGTQPLQLDLPMAGFEPAKLSPRVVTARIPDLVDGIPSIRESWPDVDTGDLTIRTGDNAGRGQVLRIHTRNELRLGRRVKYSSATKTGYNDVVTCFSPADFPQFTEAELLTRNAAISGVNTSIRLDDSKLCVINTGTPGSDSAGYTELQYRTQGRTLEVTLQSRQEDHAISVRELESSIRLWVGGSPGETGPEGGSFQGYPLELRPICCRDPHESHRELEPEELQEQLGRLPRSLEQAKTSGLDAVMVQHLSATAESKPRQVLLLRQLWLLEDGSVMVDSDSQQAVAARLLIAGRSGTSGRVILLQLLSQLSMTIKYPAEELWMSVRRNDLVPLHHGDRLQLKQRGTEKLLWEADFQVIRGALG